MPRLSWLSLPVCTLALVAACSRQSSHPTSPTSSAAKGTNAADDGALLKASAPLLVSPTNGATVPQGTTTALVIQNSTLQFMPGTPLSYQFEVYSAPGVRVYQSASVSGGSTTTTHTLTGVSLEGGAPYTWQARATYQNTFGPWSVLGSFIAPRLEGYIRGNELYDPLTNGRTIGQIVGNVTFIPGVGAKLNDFGARIVYELQEPLEDGEYSALVTGVETNTEGDKTKILSMAQGYGDLTANERRMTVEKRGDNPPGAIAWRFLTNGEGVDTIGEERVVREFDPNQTYFWEANWRDGFFNVKIVRGGVNGQVIYNFGKGYDGFYRPEPHVVYAGGGPARAGLEAQTVPGMIIRQIWVSERPRPEFANR